MFRPSVVVGTEGENIRPRWTVIFAREKSVTKVGADAADLGAGGASFVERSKLVAQRRMGCSGGALSWESRAWAAFLRSQRVCADSNALFGGATVMRDRGVAM